MNISRICTPTTGGICQQAKNNAATWNKQKCMRVVVTALKAIAWTVYALAMLDLLATAVVCAFSASIFLGIGTLLVSATIAGLVAINFFSKHN